MTQISLRDFRPIDEGILTVQQREALRRAQGLPRLSEVVGAAFGQTGLTRSIVREMQQWSYPPDPDFRITPKMVEDFGRDLPPEWWDEFGDADSMDEMTLIREQLRQLKRDREKLSQAGLTGIGLQLFAGFTDPTELLATAGATLLAGPAGGAAVKSATGARLLPRAIRGGLVAATTDTALMAADNALDPDDYSAALFIGGGIASFALGSIVDYRALRKMERSAAAITNNVVDLPDGFAAHLDTMEDLSRAEEILGVVRLSRDEQMILEARRAAGESAERAAAEDLAGAAEDVRIASAAEATEKRARFDRLLAQWSSDNRSGRLNRDGGNVDQVLRNIEKWESEHQMPAPAARTARGELIYTSDESARAAADRLQKNIDRDHVQARLEQGNIPEGARVNKPTVHVVKLNDDGWLVRLSDGDVTVDAMPYIARTVRARLSLAEKQTRYDRLAKDVQYDILSRELGGDPLPHLTDRGKVFYKSQIEQAARPEVERFNEIVDAATPDEVKRMLDADPPDTTDAALGASTPADIERARKFMEEEAAADAARGAPHGTDFDLSRLETEGARESVTHIGPFYRGSLSALTGSSKAPSVRLLSRALVEDSLLDIADGPTVGSASEWVQVQYARGMNGVIHQFDENYLGWAKSKNKRWWWNFEAQEEFFEEVGRTVRRGSGSSGDKFVEAAADAARKKYAETLALLKRHGVRGLENVPANLNYLPRLFVKSKIDKMVDEIGEDNVIELIRMSWLDGRGMEMKLQQRLARGFYESIQRIGEIGDMDMAVFFTSDAREALAAILRKMVPNITEDEMSQVLGALRKTADPDGGKVPLARRRARINEDFEMEVLVQRTGQRRKVRFDELLENNARRLQERYERQALGAAAMSKIYRLMQTPWETAASRADTLLNRLTREMREVGISEPEIRSTRSRLDTMMRLVEGRPLEENHEAAAIARAFRDFNTWRLGGRFAIAQAADLGPTVAEVGMRNLYAGVPTLQDLVHGIRNGGKFDTELARELQSYWAFGSEYLLNHTSARLDFMGDLVHDTTSRVSRVMQKGAQLTMRASGLAWLDARSRQLAGIGILEKWKGFARSGRLPSEKRLALMGLREDDAKIILEQIRKHGGDGRVGPLGVRQNGLGLDKWDASAFEARSRFIMAVNKTARRLVQQQDLGQMSQWMTTWWGRTIIQFRGFGIGAYEKHLLTGLQLHDWQAAMNLSAGLLFGGMSYVGVVALNAAGRPDREEYLAERLSFKNLVLGAWQRSNTSSILPPFIDPALWATGMPQQFTQGRTTGLTSDVFFGNPTTDLLGSVRALRLLRAPFDPNYRATQSDVRAFRQLIPWQSMYGMQQALDAWQFSRPGAQED